MQIKKIAVGIDFSEQSDVALDQSMRVARVNGADVVLVHACTVPDRPEPVPEVMEGAAAHFERLLREQLEETRGRLEELRDRAGGNGVKVSHMIIDGFADSGLAKAADELDADLLVVGTHGRHGFERFLLGSVAERAVRLTDTNVMVARPSSHGSGGYKRVLVPIDFSDITDKVVEAAYSFAGPDATVDVFNVWEVPGASWLTYDVKHAQGGSLREEMADAAAAAGRDLLARHAPPQHVKAVFSDAEDSAAHGIQKRLESGNYDLVVMGSHGRRGLRRFMLGSVAEATVRYAPCSVVVVHPDKQKEEDK